MYDLICFSHLRWDFVFQRPNHLMARAAQQHRVLFIEEPGIADRAGLTVARRQGVTVVTPSLPDQLAREDADAMLRQLVQRQMAVEGMKDPVRWYWTPMALRWSEHLPAQAVVYDCMDELAAFRGAPPDLLQEEQRLLQAADLVFTGGTQLYESKRRRHSSVHRLPSSVDRTHFARARSIETEPADQAAIPGPRLGWFGVIDERFDRELVAAVAAARPDWQLVLVGPVVKVDPADLPTGPNIHYLGPKPYESLPDYLAGWDVGIMPFALNESTRYISPTKTPEYLAAGLPVVSTPIADVVEPYGKEGLVGIARDAGQFIGAVEVALAMDGQSHRRRADAFLGSMSWHSTWDRMDRLISGVIAQRPAVALPVPSLSRIRMGAGAVPAGFASLHSEP